MLPDNNLISLTLVDGTELDVLPRTITQFESMADGKNSHFPKAKTYIRYTLGQEDHTALLSSTFDDVLRLLNINTIPGEWILLTRSDGDRLAALKANVVSRSSLLDGGSRIVLLVDNQGSMGSFDLKDSLDEVRNKMTPSMTPPEGLVELPVPTSKKKGK